MIAVIALDGCSGGKGSAIDAASGVGGSSVAGSAGLGSAGAAAGGVGGSVATGSGGATVTVITTPECTPGQQASCACAGGSPPGVQICGSDGKSYGSCSGCLGSPGSSVDSGISASLKPFIGTWSGTVQYEQSCTSGPCTSSGAPPAQGPELISVTFAVSNTGALVMTQGAVCAPIPFTQSNDKVRGAIASIEPGFGCQYGGGSISYSPFTFTTVDGVIGAITETRTDVIPAKPPSNTYIASWNRLTY